MNGANLKQVADVKIGGYQVELDEDKLRLLNLMCDDCDNTISLIQKSTEKLIRLGGVYDGIDIDLMECLRLLIDIKDDYMVIKELNVTGKEVIDGRE